MGENYGVYFGGRQVGKVQVSKQGLYYRFVCRCKMTGDVVCRLKVKCNGYYENLGILVPYGDGFGLETKLPIKRLGSGEMEFFLLPKHETAKGKFAAIYPDEPFAYIANLKGAFLEYQNGQMGIRIKAGTE